MFHDPSLLSVLRLLTLFSFTRAHVLAALSGVSPANRFHLPSSRGFREREREGHHRLNRTTILIQQIGPGRIHSRDSIKLTPSIKAIVHLRSFCLTSNISICLYVFLMLTWRFSLYRFDQCKLIVQFQTEMESPFTSL